MHVKVTQDHISRGELGDAEACPIALAIKESYPYLNTVEVFGYGVFTKCPAGDKSYDLP